MLASILPLAVRCAESTRDPAEAVLLPEEEDSLGAVVPERRREFTTARHLARRALKDLGRPPCPVPTGAAGEPLWPAGVVGSITHSRGYRAAAVAEAGQVRGLGVDAEVHAAVPEQVLRRISVPAEREHLTALSRANPSISWDVLLFSAKESGFKTWFPMGVRGLRFEDVHVTFSMDGRLYARIDGPDAGDSQGCGATEAEGKWLVRGGLVVTAFVIPS